MGNLEFEIPSDKEIQKHIAAALSSLDDKIELSYRINLELEAIAKIVYNYWFVQFDFPDESGKPYKSSGGKMIWNEELKREIPDKWKIKSLIEITDISIEQLNPLEKPSKEYKHYSIPVFDETGTYRIETGDKIKSNKFIVKNTDILVSKLNPWFNRVVYSTDESDTICSTEFVVWRTKNIQIKNFLYMTAKDSTFVTYCTQSATGTSNSHRRVDPNIMMNYRIALDEKTAERFGEILDSSIKMYVKNLNESKNFSDLRDWLLPMLMNGQVKVN